MGILIDTYYGNQVDLRAASIDAIVAVLRLEDIALALSSLRQFNGQIKEFYSVAQHSLLVCELAAQQYQLYALFRDSAKAFLGHVTGLTKLDHAYLESKLMQAVACKFGFTMDEEALGSVEVAELVALSTERRDLILNAKSEWDFLQGFLPIPRKLVPLSPREARAQFLYRANELLAGKEAAQLIKRVSVLPSVALD